MGSSDDYRDYVIKDGRFIGAFEEMYRNVPEPWHQDSLVSPAEDIALSLIPRGPLNQLSDILDIGCGLGRFTDHIFRATGATVTAIDISPTAIATAKARYPGVAFQVAAPPPLPFQDGSFDLVTMAQLLWYVLPEMQELFGEVSRVLRPEGYCLILQHFYQPGEQRYGNAYMETPEDITALCPFRVLHQVDMDRLTNWQVALLMTKN